MPGDERGSPPGGHPESAVESYLHREIPLSAVMGVRVRLATAERVDLWLPLQPNINHERTVFGGSATAAATLAAWTLLHLRLVDARAGAQLVIQRSTMEHKEPIAGDFLASCAFSDTEAWRRFSRTLQRWGKARLRVTARLMRGTREVGSFAGDFVARRR
jgi:thioesterase domain-containing protein